MTFTLGNFLVLLGTIFFAVAFFFGEGQGRGYFVRGGLLAIAGVLVGLGVLFGAPALFSIH